MSKEVKPDQVMAYLNELFTAFDELVDTYQIYKVSRVHPSAGADLESKSCAHQPCTEGANVSAASSHQC
eukprot:1144860-Pelagomonas_calceolata.AAC.1